MFQLESGRARLWRYIKNIFPILFLGLIVSFFVLGIRAASESSVSNQQKSLERALHGGAIRTYALTGCYPESLDELLDAYHITYDTRKFIVEYTPQASNLLPSIFVIPRKDFRK
ncbi:MAG: hypothetical protein IJ899_14185 [Blautia sp.]|nr:hypothetical protein [Blautia sp.]